MVTSVEEGQSTGIQCSFMAALLSQGKGLQREPIQPTGWWMEEWLWKRSKSYELYGSSTNSWGLQKLADEAYRFDFRKYWTLSGFLKSLKINLNSQASQHNDKNPKNLKFSTNELNTDWILCFCSQHEGRNSMYFVLVWWIPTGFSCALHSAAPYAEQNKGLFFTLKCIVVCNKKNSS